jgi:hypothetical protein
MALFGKKELAPLEEDLQNVKDKWRCVTYKRMYGYND